MHFFCHLKQVICQPNFFFLKSTYCGLSFFLKKYYHVSMWPLFLNISLSKYMKTEQTMELIFGKYVQFAL